ncbi:MAG: DinB family protein [Deltaproteobacteria bacterium]|nr:DinB family protein [Deltaproteobacteria bacterium]
MNTVKLLEYSQFLNRKYLEAMGKLPWEDVVKDRGASFPSLRDIYLHIVFVEDAYINYAVQGNPKYPSINYNDYDNMEKINQYLEQVDSKANAYISKITPEELTRNVERKQRDGSSMMIPVEDMLLDFFQEVTHHRGELIALFWQMDIAPPHMGFIQYSLSQKRS